jgi:cytochrome d ubiquinol oxidase subunit I
MGEPASDALMWHRLQFAFTIMFHYLFPQLTMGLAALIAAMKAIGVYKKDERWLAAARFWIRIFAVNFAFGVVTGIPMEMQFGTNWSRFSGYAGAVIGHSLGMESLFAFFLESVFLGLMVFGEKKLGHKKHLGACCLLWLGTWMSGFFIVTANAFMQHPQGHVARADGTLALADFAAYMTNPWAFAELAHVLAASLVTASFVVSAVGAYYMLSKKHADHGRTFLRIGVRAGVAASLLVAFPTGDAQAKLVAKHQPVSLAAMEGRFETEHAAAITLVGQPNVAARRLDNPIQVPAMLSFLAYGTFHSDVRGMNEFPRDEWPTSIELLYYAFHLMAGIGTIQIALMAAAAFFEVRKKIDRARPVLWALMLAFPLPYIATTAGWLTAELGRQPWLIFGLYRTSQGSSPQVHSGDALFTLIGFAGLYLLLGMLFVFLVGRVIASGPKTADEDAHA